MKPKRNPKRLERSDPFKIPKVKWPDEKQLLESVAIVLAAKPPARSPGPGNEDEEASEAHAKALAAIATNAWKARSKMIDEQSGEPREEMKRVFRHIEAIFETFRELGLEVKDHTRDVFDYGMPLKVVTSQPMPGINKERVIETIKPTIYWRNRIVQMGEVVIGTPVSLT
jgi:hypothetical protein